MGIGLCVIALARPQAGEKETEILTEGIDIMLCLDTSGSMRALDFEREGRRTDRLDVVKQVVEAFIKEYNLDKGQITTARSILEEFKSDANTFRESKKEELAQIIARQREALANRDLKGVKKARAEHKKLLAPVYDLCDEMEARLKNLLTTAQIQRHAEKTKLENGKSTQRKVTRKTPMDDGEGVATRAEPPHGGSDDSQAHADSDKG
jgi:hypothetical protein